MALSGSDADPRLQALAHLAVTVGVNIQPQQPLIISAPWEARQWVQEACRAAYQAGSGWVQTVYEDPELLRVALMTMDSVPQSALPSPEHALLSRSPDAAHLRILGPRPTLLEGISAQRLVDFHGLLKAGNTSTFHTVRCCSVPFVTEDWARFVRPGLDTAAAMDALWNDVFELCAVVGADADSRALQARLERNEQITQWLNTQQFDWIQFQNNGSELTVGLLKNTAWQGARIRAQSVVPFLSAIPLEPVHCLLDPLQVEGTLSVPQSLKIAGHSVEGLALKFQKGRLSAITATQGRSFMEQLVQTDSGAERLGQVRLTEASQGSIEPSMNYFAPILDNVLRSGLTLGSADKNRLVPGANQSDLSIDLPVGDSDTRIYGGYRDGKRSLIYDRGRFCF